MLSYQCVKTRSPDTNKDIPVILWNTSQSKMIDLEKMKPILVHNKIQENFPVSSTLEADREEERQQPIFSLPSNSISQSKDLGRDNFWKLITVGNGPQLNHIMIGRMIKCIKKFGTPAQRSGKASDQLQSLFTKFRIGYRDKNIQLSQFFDRRKPMETMIAQVRTMVNSNDLAYAKLHSAIMKNEDMWCERASTKLIDCFWAPPEKEIKVYECIKNKNFRKAIMLGQRGYLTNRLLLTLYKAKKQIYDKLREERPKDVKKELLKHLYFP